jgi:hypothetical protein
MLAVVAAPHVAAAQEVGIRTALSIVPGAVFDSADTGPSIGAAITLDLSPRIAFEGAGTYVNRGSGLDALNIQAGLLANLANVNGRVVPFVAGGAGVYRASLDLGVPRFFGGAGGQFGPGTSLCGGTGVCPYGHVPEFYARRLGALTAPSVVDGWPTRTFTDPAFHLGTGVRLYATRQVFVRPELRGLFVVGDGRVQSLATASVALGYAF